MPDEPNEHEADIARCQMITLRWLIVAIATVIIVMGMTGIIAAEISWYEANKLAMKEGYEQRILPGSANPVWVKINRHKDTQRETPDAGSNNP